MAISMNSLKQKAIKNFPKKDVQSLTITQKSRYPFFNIFQLELSRLYKIPMFQQLVEQIRLFNKQLQDWRQQKHQIRNVIITYHLYENLSSRLKYLCNFSKSQVESINGTQKIAQWFLSEKPKLRCQVKETKAAIKQVRTDQNQNRKIEDLVQYSELKRQMQQYQMMSRTAHAGILPPKQQLKQYKRKTFLPFEEDKQKQFKSVTMKKSSSASILGKNRLGKFRQSVGTMMTTASTMNETKQSFRKTVSEFKTTGMSEKQKNLNQEKEKQVQALKQQNLQKVVNTIQEEEINKQEDQKIDQIARQKQVDQEKIMQANLIQNLGEDDQLDQQLIFQEQQGGPTQQTKIYISDHDPIQLQQMEEISKQAQQSSLRRVMKVNQDKIRSKMQDLDMARNMQNWGKIKGKNATGMSRKLQSNLHLNKYRQLEHQKQNFIIKTSQLAEIQNKQKKFFNATTGFKGFRQKQDMLQGKQIIQAFYRSKSSHPSSIQSDLKKLKIKQAMGTYGKYINHIKISSNDDMPQANHINMELETEKRKSTESTFRSSSLTSLANTSVKKKQFSSLLRQHTPTKYNQDNQEEIMKIKSTLSGKMIPVEKGIIYKGLTTIIDQQTKPQFGMFTTGKDLLSNPFFPKFPNKKKKKKK